MKTATKMHESESIIEYKQENNSSEFYYENSTGAIFINSNESVWLWKEKTIQMNVSIFYDYDKYNLFLMPIDTRRKIDFSHISKTIGSGINYVTLVNLGLLPKRIKKGDLIGVGYLIPKIESHIIRRYDDEEITE